MNTTMRAMLIASLALAFTACKKEEAAPVDGKAGPWSLRPG